MDNEEYKKRLLELLTLYEQKKIDDKTYQVEYSKLVSSPLIENDNQEKTKNIIRKNLHSIIIFVVLLIIVIICIISPHIGKDYITEDINSIKEPIQRDYNSTTIIKENNTKINVELLYYYEITGLAVATHNYLPTKISNKISPYDVGIVWGELYNNDNWRNLKWIETGNRFLYWQVKDKEWYQEFGTIEGQYSNNHLIPSDDKIKKKIKKIQKGDIVKITGYLVNLSWNDEKGDYNWYSSTTRSDTGDGACELIYVTDVKWLKAN